MGQYHKAFNLDKKEVIHPHKLDQGAKAMEQLGSTKGISQALHVLLNSCPRIRGGGDYEQPKGTSMRIVGRWAGDRIAIVGDCSEDGDIEGVKTSTLYEDESYTDISEDVKIVLDQLLRG